MPEKTTLDTRHKATERKFQLKYDLISSLFLLKSKILVKMTALLPGIKYET